jgi:threonyl-tRNA synthetase
VERFFGILVEHYAGRFPLWLAPVQAVILPMNDDLIPYSTKVKDELEKQGLRVELDSRTESLKKKVREAQIQHIPLIITLGEKERETGALSVRTLDGNVRYNVGMDELIDKAYAHIKAKRSDLAIV